jgi:methionyl-tRNA synthetase
LLREIPFGEDGDFSVARLRERYTADLGNTLGNLVNRAIAMSRKYFDGKVPNIVDKDKTAVTMIVDGVMNDYSAARCDCALERIWEGLYLANKYIEETQPFKLVKTDPDAVAKILYTELEACRIYAWLINPVMPNISRSIFEQLGLDAETELAKGWKEGVTWGGLKPGSALPEPKILFPRLPEA